MVSALLSVLVLSGCSAGKASYREDAGYAVSDGEPGEYNAKPGAEAPSSSDGGSDPAEGSYAQAPSVLSEEKLVYTCDMTLETIARLENALSIDLIKSALTYVHGYGSPVSSRPQYLNDSAGEELDPDIKTSDYVDGYRPRRKSK